MRLFHVSEEKEICEFIPRLPTREDLDPNKGLVWARKTQIPIRKIVIDDLFGELIKRKVEVRIIDNLWDLCNEIKYTSFNWSMCRMRFAEKK